jgi:hypothetical protein
MDEEIEENHSGRNLAVIIIAIILMILAGGATLVYLFANQLSTDVKETFTAAQSEKLRLSAGEYVENHGNNANDLIKFMKEEDLETSYKVCDEELIMQKVPCYRLLATSRPDDSQLICEKIQDTAQKETCLMRIPVLM